MEMSNDDVKLELKINDLVQVKLTEYSDSDWSGGPPTRKVGKKPTKIACRSAVAWLSPARFAGQKKSFST